MRTILRIAVCWVAFVAALLGSGMIGALLHLHAVTPPGGSSAQTLFPIQLVAGLVLVVGLVPMARGLAAPTSLRAIALVPFYALRKLPLYAKYMFARQQQWVRTKRD